MRDAVTALMPRLRRFGVVLSGSQAEGDELAQRAAAQALRPGLAPRDQARFEIWIFQQMRALWLQDERRRRVGLRDCLRPPEPAAGGNDALPTPETIREVLASMPEEDRSVLVLVCVERFSYQEVADVLGLPVAAMMSRLARAREEFSAGIGGGRASCQVTTFPTGRRARASASGE